MRRRSIHIPDGDAEHAHPLYQRGRPAAWRWIADRLLVLVLVLASVSVVSLRSTPSRSAASRSAASDAAGMNASAGNDATLPIETALPVAWSGAVGILMNVGTVCPSTTSTSVCGESAVSLPAPAGPGGIDLKSVAFSAETPVTVGSSSTGTRTEAGKMRFDAITITKALDTATPALLRAMSEGRKLDQVILTQYVTSGTGPQPVSRYTLTEPYVTNYKITDGPEHAESFSLVFASAKFEYFPQATGSKAPQPQAFCWNVVTSFRC